MNTQVKLEHKVSFRWLIMFALPTILSSIFSSLYTTVDGVWLSITAGEMLSIIMSIYYFIKYKKIWSR